MKHQAFAGLLVAATLLSGSAFASPPRFKVLNQLHDVLHFGRQGEMTCNADGGIVYVAEGGAIAMVETATQAGMETARKRPQVGSLAPWGCDLALDPEADIATDEVGYVDLPENLLYVAGGRHGLWAMDADPRAAQSNFAMRLDDTGSDIGSTGQNSRRWCNALEFLTIEVNGQARTYLVALFAKKRGSRVRFYPIEFVRSAFATAEAAQEDLGHELDLALTDIRSVPLPSNTSVPSAVGPNEQNFGYGYDLAVVKRSSTQSEVYVAMGMHGLVRILCETDPTHLGGFTITRQDGPYFGTGSSYATQDGLYGNLKLYDADGLQVHTERPLFVALAAGEHGGSHYLYAAVDNLGWVKFDTATWGTSIPIVHHEGQPRNYSPPGRPVSNGVTLINGDRTWTRRLELVTLTTPQGEEDVLLATTGDDPARVWVEATTHEGRILDWTSGFFGPISNNTTGEYRATDPHWLIYRDVGSGAYSSGSLTAASSGALNQEASEGLGGFYVHAPPQQDEADNLVFFVGELSPDEPHEHNLWRKEYDWTSGLDQAATTLRSKNDRPGRFTFSVGTLIPHPTNPGEDDVIVTSGNESDLGQERLLFLNGNDEFEEVASTPIGTGSFGVTFDPRGQWFDANGQRWVMSVRPFAGQVRYYFQGITVDASGAQPSWTVDHEYFVTAPDDQLFTRNAYYGMGYVNPEYDAFTASLPGGSKYVFINQQANWEGVRILERDQLITDLLGQPNNFVNQEGFLSSRDILQNGTSGNFAVHREMRNLFPTSPASIAAADKMIRSFVGAFSPRVHNVNGKWILAVAGYTSLLDTTVPEVMPFATNEVWDDKYSHLFVRFYDVTNPVLPTNLPTFFGPSPQTATHRLELVTFDDGSQDRTFAFIIDFTGKLLVHEITDLASPGVSQDPDVAREDIWAVWDSGLSISDDQIANTYDLAVHKEAPDEAKVYLSTWRYGIEVLRFRPFDAAGQRFVRLDHIQTSGHACRLWLQPSKSRLLAADAFAGLRIYKD